MKNIVLDIMRRTWWAWPIAFGPPIIAAAASDHGGGAQVYLIVVVYYFFIVPFGTVASVSKTLQALPLSRQQIGQSLWLLCAALVPAVAVADQMVFYLLRIWKPKLDVLPPHLFLICSLLFVGCMGAGQMVAIFQMWFTKRTGIKRTILMDMLYGLLPCIPMLLALVFSVRFCANPGEDIFKVPMFGKIFGVFGERQSLLDGPNLAALIAAAVFTTWSWQQRHQILDAATFMWRSDAEGFFRPRRVREPEFCSRVLGRATLWIHAIEASACATAFLVLAFCWAALGAWFDPNTEFVLDMKSWSAVLCITTMMLLYITSIPWIFSVRTLRALPMPRFRLALHMLFCPIAAQLAFMLLTCMFLHAFSFLHLDLAASLTLELEVLCLAFAGLACFTLPRIGIVVGTLYWLAMLPGSFFICVSDFSTAPLPWIALTAPFAIGLGIVGIYRFIGVNYTPLRRYQELIFGVRR